MSSKNEKLCFVIQGFGKKVDYRTGRTLDLDASYEVIKDAVEAAGLKCVRADEIQHSGVIDRPMYEHLMNADLVIADLSTSNVNAAYELGVRHAVRPATTLIVAEKGWDFAFDVDRNVIRTYEHLGPDLGRREAQRFCAALTEAIQAILDAGAVDSPLYTFISGLKPPRLVRTRAVPDVALISPAGVGPAVKDLTDQASAALGKDDFRTARSLLNAAHAIRANDATIVQKLALAIYKGKEPDEMSALNDAKALIERELAPEATNDPETLGLWASVHKRLWNETANRADLDTGIHALERGFKIQRDFYNGINLAYMLNERARMPERGRAEAIADFVQAREVRRQVADLCTKLVEANTVNDDQRYWYLATLWEASVGLEEADRRVDWEARARRHAREKHLPDWMIESTETQVAKLRALLSPSPLRFVDDSVD
jgi:hypothetical protein